MNPKDLLIDEDAEGITQQITTFLGIAQEVFTCPECNVACEPSTTFDPQRMAFDGGSSLSWECPECNQHYRRESQDGVLSADLYDRE